MISGLDLDGDTSPHEGLPKVLLALSYTSCDKVPLCFAEQIYILSRTLSYRSYFACESHVAPGVTPDSMRKPLPPLQLPPRPTLHPRPLGGHQV